MSYDYSPSIYDTATYVTLEFTDGNINDPVAVTNAITSNWEDDIELLECVASMINNYCDYKRKTGYYGKEM